MSPRHRTRFGLRESVSRLLARVLPGSTALLLGCGVLVVMRECLPLLIRTRAGLVALNLALRSTVTALWVLLVALLGRSLLLRCGRGARDSLRRVVDVKLLINGGGNGLDLGSKLLLNLVKVESVVPVDEVDSETEMPESS